jgi:C_GCAxxG_C_C family probable redox protein
MKTRSEIALEKYFSDYSCAQSVLYAFCDDLGLDRDTALRLATGFGAGMARKQEVCGALSGGIMAIGLKFGRGEGQDKSVTEDAYQIVWELMSTFEAKYGSCRCRALTGYDLSTPEGQQLSKDNDVKHKVCQGCVQTVVEFVEDFMGAE